MILYLPCQMTSLRFILSNDVPIPTLTPYPFIPQIFVKCAWASIGMTDFKTLPILVNIGGGGGVNLILPHSGRQNEVK